MSWKIIQAKLPMVKEATDVRLTSVSDVGLLCQDLVNLAQECFQVITVNSKNLMISRHLITLGLSNASLVHPREVFRPAITDGAMAVVLVHNHPSGDPTPSAEDIRITRQLVQAGKILEIQVFDHLIIGKTNYSLKEMGLVDFT